MEIKRNYLKIEEIAYIVDEMIKEEFSYNREIAKVSIVSKICLDYDFGELLGDKVYNIVAENDALHLLEDEIINYYIIDKMVKEEMSVENTVKGFLNNINSKLDSVMNGLPKGTEFESLIEEFNKTFKKDSGV